MWILPSITGSQPERKINIHDWNIPNNIKLADPSFNIPQSVDLLIGADKFFELLCVGQVKLGSDLPVLQKTLFGWIVSGKFNSTISKLCCNLVTPESYALENTSLTHLIERFWEIKNTDKKLVVYSEEEQKCENMVCETITETKEGRLVVAYPFKGSPEDLGNSFETAKRRFLTLEKRFKKSPELQFEYKNFLQEYLNLDHMEPIKPSAISRLHYYIPHHCIVKSNSTSTKLRVVFDASSRTSSSVSLNDILMVGPTVQNDLFSILIRFRFWKFALTADIAKMFRQILIREDHRDFQIILWRNNPNEEFQHFRLKTLTYGLASSPFLATRCINYVADKYINTLPEGAGSLKNDMYVDNLLTGANSIEELLNLKKQVHSIMDTAHLELHKWFSNYTPLLETIPENSRDKLIKIGNMDIIRALGIDWEPREDYFTYSY